MVWSGTLHGIVWYPILLDVGPRAGKNRFNIYYNFIDNTDFLLHYFLNINLSCIFIIVWYKSHYHSYFGYYVDQSSSDYYTDFLILLNPLGHFTI